MSDYKTPNDKLITSETASDLNRCYKTQQAEFGAEDDGSFCCSSWYSLEDLEGYINYVKQQAAAQEISVDGIRFYFGVYPEDHESKAGQNTLFMCPTKSGKSSATAIGGTSNSDDITTISAMNYGSTGNPPKNDYGDN